MAQQGYGQPPYGGPPPPGKITVYQIYLLCNCIIYIWMLVKEFLLVVFQEHHHFDRLPPREDFLMLNPRNSSSNNSYNSNNNLHAHLNSTSQPDLRLTPPQDRH